MDKPAEPTASRMEFRKAQCFRKAPLLFNMYISDLPQKTGTKLAYANDLVILYLSKSFEEVQASLSQDVASMDHYYHQLYRRLKVQKSV